MVVPNVVIIAAEASAIKPTIITYSIIVAPLMRFEKECFICEPPLIKSRKICTLNNSHHILEKKFVNKLFWKTQ